jgi:hypothetical protein
MSVISNISISKKHDDNHTKNALVPGAQPAFASGPKKLKRQGTLCEQDSLLPETVWQNFFMQGK